MSTITNELDLFEKIVAKDNMQEAYKQTRKGKSKYKPKAMKFALDEVYELRRLTQSLINETYEFGGYTEFKVFEPKERVIQAPRYEDKIVQIAVNNILKDIYYPSFIYDSYACIDNKGTHKSVDRIQHFIRKAKWQCGEDTYIVKMDMKKFFYTIDRDILKNIITRKIKNKKTFNLLSKIIDSADALDDLGLPLGNTLSQIGANIYMNKVDQHAKRVLSLKYYVRYADDIVIIVKNKEKAKEVLLELKQFVETELNLSINKHKSKVFPINQGVNAMGFKIYATHKLLRNDSKKRIKRKAKKMRRLLVNGLMSPQKAEQILNSWKGHAEHGNSYNFIQKLIERNDYIYLSNSGTLKIDLNKLEEGEVNVV